MAVQEVVEVEALKAEARVAACMAVAAAAAVMVAWAYPVAEAWAGDVVAAVA